MRINLLDRELVGKNSLELIKEIVRSCSEISKVQVVRYSYLSEIQQRVSKNEDLDKVFSQAMGYRSQLKMPFWDACMVTLSSGNYSVPINFIREAGRHDTHRGKETLFERDELLDCRVQAYLNNSKNQLVCIVSEVILHNDQRLNLPLLDFHCPINKGNHKLVSQICKVLLPEGFAILESDSSYHCYGFSLLSQEDLVQFLAKALFYSPIIDRAYIAHQLLEKRCSLRISGKSDQAALPKIVEVFQEV